MKIDKKRNVIVSIFIVVFCLPVIAMAAEDFFIPEYTEEYKQWMQLSEEEKSQCIEPQMYDIPDELKESEIQAFSEGNNENVGTIVLPTKFANSYYGNVKNQGSANACWAYSAATAFETNYYITNAKIKKFSDTHMDYITSKTYNTNGFNRSYNAGGNMNIALAYATNGMGIALEESMPTTITTSTLQNVKPTSKVSEYELLEVSDLKEYLYQYGVVSAYTYVSGSQYFSSSNLWNNADLAYYCTNTNVLPNHAVTIIGWDDNYTNSAFSGQRGAYLVLNSYGSDFGNNGLYYIFYNDVFVKNANFYGVTKTDDIDYDQIYQYDTYGRTGMVGWSSSSGGTYAANVFSKQSTKTEKLTELGIYFPTDGQVTIYINPNSDNKNINNATVKFTTEYKNAGYHTIQLSKSVQLTGSKFSVCVKYDSYMGVEMSSSDTYSWYYSATSNSGESFVSSDGMNWHDLKTMVEGNSINACIKAFTEEVEVTTTITTQNKPEYTADLINYVFDYRYYADHNIDLYNAFGYDETALRNHWDKYGKAEGRASSSVFDVKYYIANNADLAKAFGYNYVAAYEHFMKYGYAEYRKSSPEYDGNYYRKNNGDLAKMTSMELIRHYSKYGKNELRVANTNYDIVNFLFDPQIYAQMNPDVVYVYGNDIEKLKMHWYRYGIAEGRIASFILDSKYYLQTKKDVAKVYGSKNYMAAYQHFLNNGFIEERQGNPVFSVKYYWSKNGDLKAAYGSNYLRTLNHFATYGKNEPRVTSANFNVIAYRNKNGDLKKAYQENYEKYFIHYLRYGQKENRICI